MKANHKSLFNKIFLTFNLVIVFTISLNVFADEGEVVVHSQEEMLRSLNLERRQVEQIVDRLVKAKRLSPEEGLKAKREIASITDSEFENLKDNLLTNLVSNNSN